MNEDTNPIEKPAEDKTPEVFELYFVLKSGVTIRGNVTSFTKQRNGLGGLVSVGWNDAPMNHADLAPLVARGYEVTHLEHVLFDEIAAIYTRMLPSPTDPRFY